MKEVVYPKIMDFSVEGLIQHIKEETGFSKAEIGDMVFTQKSSSGYHNLKRREAADRVLPREARKMLDMIDKHAMEKNLSLARVLGKWYPELLSVDGNELVRLIVEANLTRKADGTMEEFQEKSQFTGSRDFLEKCMKQPSGIKTVKMAYHSGWIWFDDRSRTEILKKLAEKGAAIRMIANPESVMEEVSKSLEDPSQRLRYKGFDQTLAEWHKYEEEYRKAYGSGTLMLKVSMNLLLHKMIIVSFNDGTETAWTRDYLYGTPNHESMPSRIISGADNEFPYYRQEYEHLWKVSPTYSEWLKTLPRKQEKMTPGIYRIWYLTGKTDGSDEDRKNFMKKNERFSRMLLTVNENNQALLDPEEGVTTERGRSDSKNVYEGDIIFIGNRIFMALTESRSLDVISLSLLAASDRDRFCGIVVKNSPLGQPVAYKCACIRDADMPYINRRVLEAILLDAKGEEVGTQISGTGLNLFFSGKLFSPEEGRF